MQATANGHASLAQLRGGQVPTSRACNSAACREQQRREPAPSVTVATRRRRCRRRQQQQQLGPWRRSDPAARLPVHFSAIPSPGCRPQEQGAPCRCAPGRLQLDWCAAAVPAARLADACSPGLAWPGLPWVNAHCRESHPTLLSHLQCCRDCACDAVGLVGHPAGRLVRMVPVSPGCPAGRHARQVRSSPVRHSMQCRGEPSFYVCCCRSAAAAARLLPGPSKPIQRPTTLLPPQARARGASGAQRRRLGCPPAAGGRAVPRWAAVWLAGWLGTAAEGCLLKACLLVCFSGADRLLACSPAAGR